MASISQLDLPFILEGTRKNFNTLVLENSEKGPVLVNYWSPQAGPCLRLYPILDKLTHEFEGRLLLVNLNTDEHGMLAREYGVTSLPTLKLFRNRQVVETVHGYQTEAELRHVFGRYLPQELDIDISKAVKTYQEGDKEQALRMLAQSALQHPRDIRPPLTMAKLLSRDRRHEEAHRLLELLPDEMRAAPEVRDLTAHLGFLLAANEAPAKQVLEKAIAEKPENLQARYQLAALKLLEDDYESAMELLLEIMRKDSGFRNGVGRNGLLAIFNLLGNEGELVARFRKLMVQYMH